MCDDNIDVCQHMDCTQIHGWINGHPHTPHLDANWGDLLSLGQHMKEMARQKREEFYLFDTGNVWMLDVECGIWNVGILDVYMCIYCMLHVTCTSSVDTQQWRQ